jgi:transcriptional/translational regulatory protein YebC/TACO1
MLKTIKKSSMKDIPNKVAFIVETATDNPTRTVATVRMHFSRNGVKLSKVAHIILFLAIKV